MAMDTAPNLTSGEIELVRDLALFAGLDPDGLREVSSKLKRRRFRRGEVVYHTEDLPGSLYVVLKGELTLRLQSPAGKHYTMSWISPGSFFGTISLLDGQERIADAVAVTPCELLVLGRDDFRDFLRSYPHQAEVLLEITAARWRNTMRRLADLAFLDVPGRLAKTLLEFQRAGGRSEDAQGVTSITQTELAAMIATSRESVGRCLKVFQDAGLIEVDGKRVRVLQRSGLEQRIRW